MGKRAGVGGLGEALHMRRVCTRQKLCKLVQQRCCNRGRRRSRGCAARAPALTGDCVQGELCWPWLHACHVWRGKASGLRGLGSARRGARFGRAGESGPSGGADTGIGMQTAS